MAQAYKHKRIPLHEHRGPAIAELAHLASRTRELNRQNADLINLENNLAAAFVRVGSDLVIRRFTPLAKTILNLKPRDAGKRIGAIGWPFDATNLEEWVAHTIRTNGTRDEEVEDKQGHSLLIRMRPYYLHENEIDGAILMFVDITARKRAELESHFFVSLAENSPEFVAMCDLSFKPIFINPAGLRKVGLDGMQEAAKLRVGDFFFPEDEPWIRENFVPKVLREKSASIEVRFRHFKTGTPIWMIHTVFPLTARDGRPVGFGSLSQDITERRRAEHKFSGLLETGPDAMVISNETGRIVLINGQTERLFGYSRDELVGKQVEMLIPARFQNAHERHRRKYMEAPRIRAMGAGLDLLARRKDGSEFPVEISLSPLKTDEGTLISAAVRDVTERRNAERALSAAHAQIRASAADLERKVIERTAELHESVESLELLTYTMAHDLRTPIRAMQGFAAALREDVPMDETGRMYAVRIAEAADRMSQLVNDLLDYARLAHLAIPLEPVELKPTLEKVVALWDDKIKSSHAEITVEEPLPAVSGNEVFLSHVMNNLLGNALKFVAPGAAPRIFIHAEAHNSTVRLWFEDNGIGIAPEYHERIFGIFQRLHATGEYPGTGLGLAFVKRAVERMSGHLGLESEPGKGSRFWIEFPRAAG